MLTFGLGEIWDMDSAVGTKLEIVAASLWRIAGVGESEEIDVDLIVGSA